jgi:hypothetical protein
LWAHLSEPPPLPSALRPGLPAALDQVVQRALAKAAEDRQPSAGDLGRAARAAAGGDVAQPERTVARGAAAPGAAPALPGLLDGSRTMSAARTVAGTPRKRALVAGALIALALAVVVAVLATRGDGGGDVNRAVASPSPQAAPAVPRVGETIEKVGFRPRGIAVANADLWVISATRGHLERIRADTLQPHGSQPRVGRGAVSIAAHGDAVFVAISRQGSVIELDAGTGRVRQRIEVPFTPILVDAGANGIWIAAHRAGPASDLLFHYDMRGNRLGRVKVPYDITALEVGGGRAWIAHGGVPRILGYDVKLRARDRQYLTAEATELAYGDRRLWVSEPAAASLGRYDPRSRGIVESRVVSRPEGLAVAGGRVFIAGYTTQNLVVVDQKSLKPVGDPITVPHNPLAVEAGAGHVWVSGIGENTLSRIDY